ncbi:hypothetical protein HPP92_000737 [Vanilla planifolia]|uniref:Uncharacterized protein n=1 Tax=Vanilla planifolia TaxID=51239 RepID=A0A835VGX1_VANPL|nr:hypothetical protein HPP92_000737 [Vanilla planifolia]
MKLSGAMTNSSPPLRRLDQEEERMEWSPIGKLGFLVETTYTTFRCLDLAGACLGLLHPDCRSKNNVRCPKRFLNTFSNITRRQSLFSSSTLDARFKHISTAVSAPDDEDYPIVLEAGDPDGSHLAENLVKEVRLPKLAMWRQQNYLQPKTRTPWTTNVH